MSKRLIISISRQHGSGGRTVGRLLAEKLGIEYYDRKLLEEVARKEHMSVEEVEEANESAGSLTSLAFPFGFSAAFVQEYDAGFYVLSDRIYQEIAGQIQEAADKGSCVIVGRVSDEILKHDPDLITVYIHGDIDDRVRRVMETDGVDEKEARKLIKKADRNRESYHNYYAVKKWGEADSYDICISTSRFGIEGAATRLMELLKVE